ncbi:MAG: peptidylprolyl isomerase [Planctomycetes bacterium]|nr:peptidylprolyl isomerase [Planctomycetota bacterium]
MEIGTNSIVSMSYSVATAEGEQVDQSQDGHPMVYLHGHGQIIPGLEAALAGHKTGDAVEAEIAPENAYGAYDAALDLQVSRELFPDDVQKKLKPGFQFEAEHPTKEGEHVLFTVHQVEKDAVKVSGNHQLAGQTLLFKVRIVDVRPATQEELSHGHAHGPGGHHHH